MWPVIQALYAAARKVHPSEGLKSTVKRATFVARGYACLRSSPGFFDGSVSPSLARTMAARPHIVGAAVWPYVNSSWTPARRLQAIRTHYIEVERLHGLDIDIGDVRTVCDLQEIYPGLKLVMDRPEWFLREGELSLNLFVAETRVYTLAFSLGRDRDSLLVYIGGLQGRDIPDAQTLYHDLTKALHGTRPRDFLVICFLFLCGAAGVNAVLAVSDHCRHHRHAFFGHDRKLKPSSDYDEIWGDRGGVPGEDGFYRLEPVFVPRVDAEIPAKKRALYRRRYELLSRVKVQIGTFIGRQ